MLRRLLLLLLLAALCLGSAPAWADVAGETGATASSDAPPLAGPALGGPEATGPAPPARPQRPERVDRSTPSASTTSTVVPVIDGAAIARGSVRAEGLTAEPPVHVRLCVFRC